MNIRFQEHLPLTINDLKGWCILSSSCPSIWKFIEKLKEDSSLNQMALNQMQMAQKMTEAANSLQLCAYWELNNHI